MDCELCDSIEDKYRIFMENDYAFAMIIREPQVEFHSLAIPKRHVEHLNELKPEESQGLNDLLDAVQKRIEKVSKTPVFIFLNSKKFATQPHIHYQIVPLDIGIRDIISSAKGVPIYPKVKKEYLTSMAEKLK